ncbi:MAG TPA: tripartite tricarboxylate transporter substrate-binding protein [Alphaproteobacteria bacterium]|nr:tripartite tricarboxylate transporter substrate-binding protein [Alphaproteobacteria bacterium]
MNACARVVRCAAGAALAVCFIASSAAADAVGDFYKGKQLTLIISLPPGGGYDAYARAVGRHLADHLAGAPTVVPQNMPGAGGLRATDYLYSKAPKDGSVIAAIQPTVPFEPLFGTPNANFDVTRFNWLGSPNSEVGLLITWHASPVKTIAAAESHEFTVGATGAASTPAYYSRVMNAVLGTKQKIVSGYSGQPEALLAMERGEIDGFGSAFWSSLKATKADWISGHKINILLQYALEPHPELPNVPFALDLAKNAEDKLLLEVAVAPLSVGRPFVAPPGVPADRLKALRTALQATFKDPAFLADAKKQRLEVTTTKTGEQLSAIMAKVYAAPPKIIARLRDIYEEGRREAQKEKKKK